ncbi:MAG TPA: polyhydroxyalkanoic acid system family protein [Novosphingobium sp.]|nr:polyhydroxyalkanoic acid system family protein [Novosphingobium sp.]
MPHTLGRDEVRRRMHARSDELAGLFPGGAQVDVSWPQEDRMALAVKFMGQSVAGSIDVTETELVFDFAVPLSLAFLEPMVRGVVKDKAQKLLA